MMGIGGGRGENQGRKAKRRESFLKVFSSRINWKLLFQTKVGHDRDNA